MVLRKRRQKRKKCLMKVYRTVASKLTADFVGHLEIRFTKTLCNVIAHIRVSGCDLPLLSGLTVKNHF